MQRVKFFIIAIIFWLALFLLFFMIASFLSNRYDVSNFQAYDITDGILPGTLPSIKPLTPVQGSILITQCVICHGFQDGTINKIGPNLRGVVGRAIASVPNYSYSQAIKNFAANNPVWSEELLDKFLLNPRQLIPNTKMSWGGLRDKTKREKLIFYLKNQVKN